MGLALVTGASRGIGLAVARSLVLDGRSVRLGVRDLARVPTVAGAEPVHIDLADPASIESCARALIAAGVPVDLLVNNAGVYDAPAAEIWATNLRGPILLVRALEPLLRPGAVIVNVSSGLGALSSQQPELRERLGDPGLTVDGLLELADQQPGGYGASKATLNAHTRLLAQEGAHINSIDPGWVRTRMGGIGAPRSLEQGAQSVLWSCRLGDRGPWGGFFRDGRLLPW